MAAAVDFDTIAQFAALAFFGSILVALIVAWRTTWEQIKEAATSGTAYLSYALAVVILVWRILDGSIATANAGDIFSILLQPFFPIIGALIFLPFVNLFLLWWRSSSFTISAWLTALGAIALSCVAVPAISYDLLLSPVAQYTSSVALEGPAAGESPEAATERRRRAFADARNLTVERTLRQTFIVEEKIGPCARALANLGFFDEITTAERLSATLYDTKIYNSTPPTTILNGAKIPDERGKSAWNPTETLFLFWMNQFARAASFDLFETYGCSFTSLEPRYDSLLIHFVVAYKLFVSIVFIAVIGLPIASWIRRLLGPSAPE